MRPEHAFRTHAEHLGLALCNLFHRYVWPQALITNPVRSVCKAELYCRASPLLKHRSCLVACGLYEERLRVVADGQPSLRWRWPGPGGRDDE